jgi:hypothetical protein
VYFNSGGIFIGLLLRHEIRDQIEVKNRGAHYYRAPLLGTWEIHIGIAGVCSLWVW